MARKFTLENFNFMTKEKVEVENEMKNSTSIRVKKLLGVQMKEVNYWLKKYNKQFKNYSSFAKEKKVFILIHYKFL